MFNNKFNIKSFIMCASDTDISNTICRIIINYYVGETSQTELKLAIAEFYCSGINKEYLSKSVEILEGL